MSEQTAVSTQSEAPKLPRLTAPVDVFESDDHYLVRADVPGVQRDDIDISFHDGELKFEATRASEAVYVRSLGFGDDVDPDAIEAKLERGVLELQLSKAAANKPRKITIQA